MSTAFSWPSFAQAGADVDAVTEQARQQGFEAGHQRGMEQAQAEQQALRGHLKQSLAALTAAGEARLEAQAAALTSLAFAVLEALLRVELRSNRTVIESLVSEALGELGAQLDAVKIFAHPAEVAWLKDLSGFEIVADDAVAEGGLSVRLPKVSVEFDLLRRLEELRIDDAAAASDLEESDHPRST